MVIVVGDEDFRLFGRGCALQRTLLDELGDADGLLPHGVVQDSVNDGGLRGTDETHARPVGEDARRHAWSDSCRPPGPTWSGRLQSVRTIRQDDGAADLVLCQLRIPLGPCADGRRERLSTGTLPPIRHARSLADGSWRVTRPGHSQLGGDPILQRKQVVELSIGLHRTGHHLSDRIDQARGDSQLIPKPLIATGDHPPHPKLPAQAHGRGGIEFGPVGHGEDPLGRGHTPAGPSLEVRQESLGDPVPDPIVLSLT